jgi:hypothetical protein
MIFGNVTEGYAFVDVPDDVHGLSKDDLSHETAHETTEGVHYPRLCKKCVDKIHANFDDKYREHAGEFRIKGA